MVDRPMLFKKLVDFCLANGVPLPIDTGAEICYLALYKTGSWKDVVKSNAFCQALFGSGWRAKQTLITNYLAKLGLEGDTDTQTLLSINATSYLDAAWQELDQALPGGG